MEAAGSSSEVTGQENEVFLSFRGADTRKGFTDHLYLALDRAGVRVFRDNEKLHVGDEIGPQLIQAIKRSAISIPIFSRNYADSKWCLKEFALMMECRQKSNQAVLPIFYDVSPNEVQHQNNEGTFQMAFAEHLNKYDAETVQQWRNALSEVGSLKGWDLANTFDGHEGKLVEMVVAEVRKRLNKGHIVLKDNLVGVDEKINEVMRLLEVNAKDVRVVGIWGMGGIGKTTLASAIYNQVSDQFDCCGFLENVRENASQPRGLQLLQGIIVSKLSKTERRDFATVTDGTKELRDRFRGKKVLILLDDVDKKEHLEALGANIISFGEGSRVVVTTRDSGILDGYRDKIYELKGMDTHHALQLFCNIAFRAESPTSELQELAKDIVETTGGLPLALEVIGSFLAGRNQEIWESTLQKLQHIPDKKVEAILRISYEALTEEQKYIFLDIACFFIGVDKRTASYIWKDRFRYSPACELDELCSKSLIRIQDGFTIWMHDQLRDLGRAVVKREFNEPEKRVWLWSTYEFRDFLMEHEGLPNVEAICLDGPHSSDDRCLDGAQDFLTDGLFRALPRLRFMKLNGAGLVGNFQQLLINLRWLSWKMPPFKYTLLTNLNLKNLIVLNLSGSRIRDHWFVSFFQGATKLKVLDLSDCKRLTKTPELSVFPELERLILKGCSSLQVIDSSIGKLRSLIYLNLESCGSLQKLPDQISASLKELIIDCSDISKLPVSIGLLIKLQKLSLRHSCIKELPDSIGQLNSLVELNLEGTNVKTFPRSVGNLKNLEKLYFCGSDIQSLDPIARGSLKKLKVVDASKCRYLKGAVPTELGRLHSLQFLRMSDTGIINLPETISSLSQLQALDLSGCHQLEAVPHLPISLVNLDVTCKSVTPIPNLPDLINLEELRFDSCNRMVEVPQGIAKLKKLRKLSIQEAYSLKSICGLPINLNELYVNGCDRFEEIQGIGEVVYLRTLSIINKGLHRPGDLEWLPDLSKLQKLHTIKVKNCKLVEIQGFGWLYCLTELSIAGCSYLETLPDLSTLESLKSLNVSGCEKLHHLKGLDELIMLEELDIGWCEAIRQLPNLSNLKRLRHLDAECCEKLQGLKGLDGLEALENLDIAGCKAIGQLLPSLSNLKCLRKLTAEGCEKLRGIEGFDGLETLEELNIAGCKSIRQLLPNVSNLKCLRKLNAKGCEKLQDLEGLDELKALEMINIAGCKAIGQLSSLSNLQRLLNLNAEGCEKVQGLEGLDGLESLNFLNITGCKAIGQLLPSLSNLKCLQKLNAEGCEKLQGLEGLDGLEALEELNMARCKAIGQMPNLSNLKRLTHLNAEGCEKLQGLEVGDRMEALWELNIEGCKAIQQLPNLSKLKRLQDLNAKSCVMLQGLEGLDGLETLQELNIAGCKEIQQMPNMSNLKRLSHLNAEGCEKLQGLEALDKLEALWNLNIAGCKAIGQLPNLSNLKRLRCLNAKGCEKLQGLEGLDGLEKLEELNISGCKAIGELPDLSNLKHLRRLYTKGCEKLQKFGRLKI